ncbi:MAG: 1,4-dihydroxy-6-naphthoate synthase [Mycobacteriales bacterium]
MTLQLAISPCPNDTFVFHALVHGLLPGGPDALGEVTARYADIDVLNSWAVESAPDVVKVSYGALPWLLERYALLPSGGALGRGCGPLVLVRPGRDDLAGAHVVVPGERTTAYLLFRLWAEARGASAITVAPFDTIMPAVRDGTADAGLVIHESRFTYPSYGLTCLADLGQFWEELTGLPIPLGAVLARRERPAGLPPALRWPDGVGQAVRDSVEHAWTDPQGCRDYVRAHAQEMDDAVTSAHIELYVNSFTADLGPEGYAAVEELFGRAAAAGLTPAVPRGALLAGRS